MGALAILGFTAFVALAAIALSPTVKIEAGRWLIREGRAQAFVAAKRRSGHAARDGNAAIQSFITGEHHGSSQEHQDHGNGRKERRSRQEQRTGGESQAQVASSEQSTRRAPAEVTHPLGRASKGAA